MDTAEQLHPSCRRIYEFIQAEPWLWVSELERRLDIPRSTLKYHLQRLDRLGLVRVENFLGRERYGVQDFRKGRMHAALVEHAPRLEEALDVFHRAPEVGPTKLARQLGVSYKTARGILAKLIEVRLVVPGTRRGKYRCTRAHEAASRHRRH